jgi:hypothetical protein
VKLPVLLNYVRLFAPNPLLSLLYEYEEMMFLMNVKRITTSPPARQMCIALRNSGHKQANIDLDGKYESLKAFALAAPMKHCCTYVDDTFAT